MLGLCKKLFAGALAALAVLVASAASALAQGRTGHVWNEPALSGIREIGGDFGRYSSGVGGLQRGNPYSGSVLSAPSPSLRRASDSGSIPGMGDASVFSPKAATLAPKASANPAPTKLNPVFTAGTEGAINSEIFGKETMLNLSSYLAAMGYSTELKSDSDQPIASFVPTEPSIFQERMRQGDQAFRAGRYEDAADQFQVALALAKNAPECHLSEAQALFALGRYYPASYHLQRALEQFPELPLLKIDLHGLYGNAGDWPKQLARLREEIQPPNRDPQPRLVLAYMQYFNGDHAETASLLREVAEQAERQKMPEVLTAAERFWNGMVVAGEASGSLAPASQPSATAPAGSPATRTAPPGGSGPPVAAGAPAAKS